MKNYTGMTILETSIAVMVFSITMLGIFSAIYTAGRISAMSRDRVKAVQLAQSRIEEEKNKQYTNILSAGPVNNSLPNGTTTVDVTLRPEGKEIKVTINWLLGRSEMNETLATFIRRE